MNRHQLKRRFIAVAAVGSALVIFSSVLFGAIAIWNRPMDLGPSIEVRDIVLFLDATRTMDPKAHDSAGGINFAKAKAIVRTRVLPQVGPGDRVSGYRVGTGFSEGENVMFSGSLGGIPKRLLDTNVLGRAPAGVVEGLWNHATQTMDRERWMDKVETVGMEPPKESDYFHAFEYAAGRLRRSAATGIRRLEIVVIGDLEQNPRPDPFLPPPPAEDETGLFSGIRVHLVYPFRAGDGHRGPDARALQEFWLGYLSARGATDVTFATFDEHDPILEANVLDQRHQPVE